MKRLKLPKKLFLIALGLCLCAHSAQAGLMIENSFFYNLNSIGNEDTSTRIFDSLFLGSTFGKGFFIGWNTNYGTRVNTLNGSNSAISGYEMGPKLGKFINKSESLSIALMLSPLVKANSTLVDGTTESWSGMGAQTELTYAPQVSKRTWFGVKIIFDYVIYNQSTNSNNVTSSINFASPMVMPCLYLSWRFN